MAIYKGDEIPLERPSFVFLPTNSASTDFLKSLVFSQRIV